MSALPASAPQTVAMPLLKDYRIGMLDELRVTVFREPELSADNVVVDVAGRISLPLVGPLDAVGRTTDEIAADLRERLNERYLRDARVSVAVIKAASYVFTIEGEVRKPGTYTIPGRVTLLQSVAIGEGLTERARMSEVLVFRTVEGKRYAARFNLRDIRAGLAEDPELKVGDTVVVNYSPGQQIYKDVLQIVPGLAGVFVALGQNRN